jgi:hypothetical protein
MVLKYIILNIMVLILMKKILLLDFTGYPYTNEIDTVADANTISISVYYRLYTTQLWTWNGVAGSGGTETVYYNPDYVNVTNKVNCDVSVANAFNYASMIIITFKLSANNSNTAREYKIEWNWLNHNPDYNIQFQFRLNQQHHSKSKVELYITYNKHL